MSKGRVYRGQFVGTLREGLGIAHYSSGDTYAGQWLNSKPHGFGVYVSRDEQGERTYAGEWVDGERHGTAVFKDPSGREYLGGYAFGEPHGVGIYRHADGRRTTYNQWQNGKVAQKNQRFDAGNPEHDKTLMNACRIQERAQAAASAAGEVAGSLEDEDLFSPSHSRAGRLSMESADADDILPTSPDMAEWQKEWQKERQKERQRRRRTIDSELRRVQEELSSAEPGPLSSVEPGPQSSGAEPVQEFLVAAGIPSGEANSYADRLCADGFDTPQMMQGVKEEELLSDYAFKKGHARAFLRALEK